MVHSQRVQIIRVADQQQKVSYLIVCILRKKMIKCPFVLPGRRWRAESWWNSPSRRHSSSHLLQKSPRPPSELRLVQQWRSSAWPIGIWISIAEHQFLAPLLPLFFHSYDGIHRSRSANSGALLLILWVSLYPEWPLTARWVHWWWEKSSLRFYTPLVLQRHRYLQVPHSCEEILCAL